MNEKKSWMDVHADEVLSDNSNVENCKQCKDCIFISKLGYDRATCTIYQNPGHKPLRVIDNKGICEYYNDGKDAE